MHMVYRSRPSSATTPHRFSPGNKNTDRLIQPCKKLNSQCSCDSSADYLLGRAGQTMGMKISLQNRSQRERRARLHFPAASSRVGMGEISVAPTTVYRRKK